MAKRAANTSFSMDHKLGIDVVRDLPDDDQGRCNDFLGVESWEGAEEFSGAIVEVRSIREAQRMVYEIGDAPWTRHECVFQQQELSHNAQDIKVRSICKEKIPQVQHFG